MLQEATIVWELAPHRNLFPSPPSGSGWQFDFDLRASSNLLIMADRNGVLERLLRINPESDRVVID